MRPFVRIAGLEIGDELGHGGFSVVYRARRGDTACALKVPHVRGLWTRWVYREAVALARVHHPGLPRVLEVGEAEGLPYLLMELVEGETLAERLRRGTLPVDAVLELGCQLADALRAVHEIGLVHRDVKPRNIILDAAGKARLVDFGFVAPAGSGAGREAVGTRRYSAPEQFAAAERVDGRADLYALGRVLHECLAGNPGFDTPPSLCVIELTSAGVPASVARIVCALVARSAEDRYPDALAVLAELHRVRAGGLPRGPAAFEAARLEPPLMGRDAELARFVGAWRDVESNGGRVVLVEGIRGAGKTRFLRACTARVRDEGRGRSLEARCREGDPPLSALRRVFATYFASLARMAPQDRSAATTALRASASGPLAALAAVVAPGFSEVLGIENTNTVAVPDAFAEGASELVLRLARHAGPLLLCFDDLQWIDPVSRDVLVAIADRAHEAPVLLLAAARPTGGSAAFARIDAAGPRHSTRVSLGPLALRQTAALIASHLGVAAAEPALVRRIGALADDTPVGVIEVLGALLDAGALRFRDNGWELHEAVADRIALPAGALTYLGGRVQDLPPATRRVLEIAAVLGTSFQEALLAGVLDLAVADVDFALADGRRSGLLEVEGGGRHRFSHDSLRELLAGALPASARRGWHQRAAEVLARTPRAASEDIYACALHFAAGEPEQSPAAAFDAARAAAELAADRFDDETALRFLAMAKKFGEAAGLPLGASFLRKTAEAHLRIGELDESLRSFRSALAATQEPVARAALLARVAWVSRARSDPEQAWAALGSAFEELGTRMPRGDASEALASSATERPPLMSAQALDVLYELHHQNARLGIESGMPLRSLQSSLQVLSLAGGAGPSVALARALATYGAVLVFLGRRAEADDCLEKAQDIATRLGDPSTLAFCLQRRSFALVYLGQFEEGLSLFRQCVDEYGPWLELAEFCLIVATGDVIESVRGRATHAAQWIGRAIDRLRRSQHATLFARHLLFRAQAAIASLGIDGRDGPWLAAQLDASQGRAESAFQRMVSWGPRARLMFDTASLGAGFDALVSEFQAEGHEPASAHIALIEFYAAVAHARLHQCLRATQGERRTRVAQLHDAARDLRAAAKSALGLAHSSLIDGALAWLDGDAAEAHRLLVQADALASNETCPWVAWGVARVRAHMLREKGKLEAARDQARVAEMLARTHGAEPRARWVREEFSLPAPEAGPAATSLVSSGRRSSRRARRQLASLLHLVRAPYGEMRPAQQGAAIVDDLVRELSADRVYVLFAPGEDDGARLLIGRSRLGELLAAPEGWRDEALRSVGAPSRPSHDLDAEPPRLSAGLVDRTRVVVLPLLLHERTVGSVLVERAASEPAFSPDDHELLAILTHQVPLALELSRLLAERDQLQVSVQQSQKMEVVGQLAGSVAHDFNNMLSVIQASQQELVRNRSLDADAREDLHALGDAADRAAKLASRLLAFSRQGKLALGSVDLNHAVKGIEPLFARLASTQSGIALTLDLGVGVHHGFTDEASLAQAIMNLVVNARDAMPDGGRLRISTRNVVLGGEDVRRGAPAAGDYVMVEVADSGHGIAPEILSRIFDPFFTTKPVGKGTGLGLTGVYSFAKQCGGHVDLSSEVGRGTAFRLYFRRSEPLELERRLTVPPAAVVHGVSPSMILVVDDDAAVRDVTRALLEQGGYRVLTATGSADALRFARTKGTEIALVIMDVHMPEMSGPELGKRLADLNLPAKVLFVSGAYLDDEPSPLHLHKPFSSDALLGRVRTLLHS